MARGKKSKKGSKCSLHSNAKSKSKASGLKATSSTSNDVHRVPPQLITPATTTAGGAAGIVRLRTAPDLCDCPFCYWSEVAEGDSTASSDRVPGPSNAVTQNSGSGTDTASSSRSLSAKPTVSYKSRVIDDLIGPNERAKQDRMLWAKLNIIELRSKDMTAVYLDHVHSKGDEGSIASEIRDRCSKALHITGIAYKRVAALLHSNQKDDGAALSCVHTICDEATVAINAAHNEVFQLLNLPHPVPDLTNYTQGVNVKDEPEEFVWGRISMSASDEESCSDLDAVEDEDGTILERNEYKYEEVMGANGYDPDPGGQYDPECWDEYLKSGGEAIFDDDNDEYHANEAKDGLTTAIDSEEIALMTSALGNGVEEKNMIDNNCFLMDLLGLRNPEGEILLQELAHGVGKQLNLRKMTNLEDIRDEFVAIQSEYWIYFLRSVGTPKKVTQQKYKKALKAKAKVTIQLKEMQKLYVLLLLDVYKLDWQVHNECDQQHIFNEVVCDGKWSLEDVMDTISWPRAQNLRKHVFMVIMYKEFLVKLMKKNRKAVKVLKNAVRVELLADIQFFLALEQQAFTALKKLVADSLKNFKVNFPWGKELHSYKKMLKSTILTAFARVSTELDVDLEIPEDRAKSYLDDMCENCKRKGKTWEDSQAELAELFPVLVLNYLKGPDLELNEEVRKADEKCKEVLLRQGYEFTLDFKDNTKSMAAGYGGCDIICGPSFVCARWFDTVKPGRGSMSITIARKLTPGTTMSPEFVAAGSIADIFGDSPVKVF